MPATLATLEIEGGINTLKCPATGIDVIVPEDGFDSDAEHSPNLRFFIDWVGETWVADPADLDANQTGYQQRIVDLLAAPPEDLDQQALVAECLSLLPGSALVLEMLDPPSGSFDGTVCYACFDLAPTASTKRLRLLAAS